MATKKPLKVTSDAYMILSWLCHSTIPKRIVFKWTAVFDGQMRGIQQQYAPLESQSSCSYLDHFHVYLTALTGDESQKTLPTHLNLLPSPSLSDFEKFEKRKKPQKHKRALIFHFWNVITRNLNWKRASRHLTFPCWVRQCEKTPLFQFESVVYSLLLYC